MPQDLLKFTLFKQRPFFFWESCLEHLAGSSKNLQIGGVVSGASIFDVAVSEKK